MFCAAEFKFIRQQDMDCLYGNNIHVMNFPNTTDCSNWCSKNSKCGGYAAIGIAGNQTKCFFKNEFCKISLYQKGYVTTFIQQGNWTTVLKYKNMDFKHCSNWGFSFAQNFVFVKVAIKNVECKIPFSSQMKILNQFD